MVKHINNLKKALDTLPDDLKSWNGFVLHEDVWLDQVMGVGSEVWRYRHEKKNKFGGGVKKAQ